ncbi:MAG: hypothetical protein ABW219_15415 [Ilumatobacteraceae bacterium]
MPSRALLLAVTATVVLAAACGDDDDSSTDITDVAGDFGEIVESEGTVLAVSTQGQAAVQLDDDELCIVDIAAGGDPRCTAVDVERSLLGSSAAFSPDGSKLAFDALADMASAYDSDVRVLDVDSGEVVTIADDGSQDDPAAPQDVLPAWVDDDELAFLRLPGMGTGRRDTAQVVFAELDGDVDVVDTDGLTVRDVAVGGTAAALDGSYLFAASSDPSRLVTVDDDGLVEVVTDLDESGGSVGGTSRDGERAVVVINGRTLEPFPAVHVATDGDDVVTTSSPFQTFAATVSPDGSIVAATAVANEGGRTGITLWDPEVGDQQLLRPGDGVPTISGVRSVVWTDDDRIVLWSSKGWQVVDVE